MLRSRGRAYRRAAAVRVKAHARQVGARWRDEAPHEVPADVVGKLAVNHCRPCSCYGCKKHGGTWDRGHWQLCKEPVPPEREAPRHRSGGRLRTYHIEVHCRYHHGSKPWTKWTRKPGGYATLEDRDQALTTLRARVKYRPTRILRKEYRAAWE